MLRSDDDRTRGANAALGHITKLDHTVVRIDGVHLRKGSMVIRGIRGIRGGIRGHHTQLSVPSLGEPSVVVSLMPAFSGGCGSTEVAHFRSGGSLPGSTRLGVSGRVGMSCVWCPRIPPESRIHAGRPSALRPRFHAVPYVRGRTSPTTRQGMRLQISL